MPTSIYFDATLRVRFNAILPDNKVNTDETINENINLETEEIGEYITTDTINKLRELTAQNIIIEVSDGTSYWCTDEHDTVDDMLTCISDREIDITECEIWYTRPATLEDFRTHDFTLIKKLGLSVEAPPAYVVNICELHNAINVAGNNEIINTIPLQAFLKYSEIPNVTVELHGAGTRYD